MENYGFDLPDMSDYVVHFTKPSVRSSAYDVMLSILASGQLRASGPYGIAAGIAPDLDGQKVVCFSEAPLDALNRIVRTRGFYGIAFSKRFLIARGGGSIWYVEPDGQVAAAVRQTLLAQPGVGTAADPAWRMTPFIEFPGDEPDGPYRWEREWRHVGNLNFSESDPSFLFIPEDLHDAAREFFDTARDDNSGPCYECRFLDPQWDRTRLMDELATPRRSL